MREAVLRSLRGWRSPPWYGEPLSLEEIVANWVTPDAFPSQADIDKGNADASAAIESIADAIVATLAEEA